MENQLPKIEDLKLIGEYKEEPSSTFPDIEELKLIGEYKPEPIKAEDLFPYGYRQGPEQAQLNSGIVPEKFMPERPTNQQRITEGIADFVTPYMAAAQEAAKRAPGAVEAMRYWDPANILGTRQSNVSESDKIVSTLKSSAQNIINSPLAGIEPNINYWTDAAVDIVANPIKRAAYDIPQAFGGKPIDPNTIEQYVPRYRKLWESIGVTDPLKSLSQTTVPLQKVSAEESAANKFEKPSTQLLVEGIRKKDMSKLRDAGYQFLYQSVDILPQMALQVALAKNPAALLASFGLMSSGSKMSELENDQNMSQQDKYANAALTGLAEMASEGIFTLWGLNRLFPEGAKSLKQMMRYGLALGAKDLLLAGAAEGAEEMFSETSQIFIDHFSGRALPGEEGMGLAQKLKNGLYRIAESGIVGAIGGLQMGPLGVSSQYITSRQAQAVKRRLEKTGVYTPEQIDSELKRIFRTQEPKKKGNVDSSHYNLLNNKQDSPAPQVSEKESAGTEEPVIQPSEPEPETNMQRFDNVMNTLAPEMANADPLTRLDKALELSTRHPELFAGIDMNDVVDSLDIQTETEEIPMSQPEPMQQPVTQQQIVPPEEPGQAPVINQVPKEVLPVIMPQQMQQPQQKSGAVTQSINPVIETQTTTQEVPNAETVRSDAGQVYEGRNVQESGPAESGQNLQQQTPESTGGTRTVTEPETPEQKHVAAIKSAMDRRLGAAERNVEVVQPKTKIDKDIESFAKKKMKKNAVFFKSPELSGVNGFVSPDDPNTIIYLNADGDPVGFVLVHEFVHLVEKSDPETYAMFRDTIRDIYNENSKSPDAYDKALKKFVLLRVRDEVFASGGNIPGDLSADIKILSEDGEISPERMRYYEGEFLADNAGLTVADFRTGGIREDFVRRLDRSTWQKIKDYLTELVDRIFTGPDKIAINRKIDAVSKLFDQKKPVSGKTVNASEGQETKLSVAAASERELSFDSHLKMISSSGRIYDDADGSRLKIMYGDYLGSLSDIRLSVSSPYKLKVNQSVKTRLADAGATEGKILSMLFPKSYRDTGVPFADNHMTIIRASENGELQKLWNSKRKIKDLTIPSKFGGNDVVISLDNVLDRELTIFQNNPKLGISLDFSFFTCTPTSGCDICYAAAKIMPSQYQRLIRNAIWSVADPEGFADAAVAEINEIKKTAEKGTVDAIQKFGGNMLRINSYGDIGFPGQTQAINRILEKMPEDTVVSIFSRNHSPRYKGQGALDQINVPNGRIVSINASIDRQLVKEYGIESLRKAQNRRWNLSYLFVGEEDLKVYEKLLKNDLLPVIHMEASLFNNEEIRNKMRDMFIRAGYTGETLEYVTCPCSVRMVGQVSGCVGCKNGTHACFRYASEETPDKLILGALSKKIMESIKKTKQYLNSKKISGSDLYPIVDMAAGDFCWGNGKYPKFGPAIIAMTSKKAVQRYISSLEKLLARTVTEYKKDEPSADYIKWAKTAVSNEGNVIGRKVAKKVSETGELKFSVRSADNSRYMELAKDPEKNRTELLKMVEQAAKKANRAIPGPAISTRKPSPATQSQMSDLLQTLDARPRSEKLRQWFRDEYIPELKAQGIRFVDAYHVTDADPEALRRDGLKGSALDYIGRSSGNLRESSVYLFLDPDDIADGYDGILSAKKSVNSVVHLRIPVERVEDMIWDSNFNTTFGTYSSVRILGDVSPDMIAGVYSYYAPSHRADPVTYDDQGNVIPLSERFNEKNNDIRLSLVGVNDKYANKAKEILFKQLGSRQDVYTQIGIIVLNPRGWYDGKQVHVGSETKLAVQMWKDSKTVDEIKRATGLLPIWSNNIKLMYKPNLATEVSDEDATINNAKWGNAELLGDLVQLPALYKIYPGLAKIPIRWGKTKLEYSNKTIKLPTEMNDFDSIINGRLGAVLHEAQHAIAEIEGWPIGDSPVSILQMIGGVVTDKEIENKRSRYYRHPGEIMAYETQMRQPMTKDQRKKLLPFPMTSSFGNIGLYPEKEDIRLSVKSPELSAARKQGAEQERNKGIKNLAERAEKAQFKYRKPKTIIGLVGRAIDLGYRLRQKGYEFEKSMIYAIRKGFADIAAQNSREDKLSKWENALTKIGDSIEILEKSVAGKTPEEAAGIARAQLKALFGEDYRSIRAATHGDIMRTVEELKKQLQVNLGRYYASKLTSLMKLNPNKFYNEPGTVRNYREQWLQTVAQITSQAPESMQAVAQSREILNNLISKMKHEKKNKAITAAQLDELKAKIGNAKNILEERLKDLQYRKSGELLHKLLEIQAGSKLQQESVRDAKNIKRADFLGKGLGELEKNFSKIESDKAERARNAADDIFYGASGSLEEWLLRLAKGDESGFFPSLYRYLLKSDQDMLKAVYVDGTGELNRILVSNGAAKRDSDGIVRMKPEFETKFGKVYKIRIETKNPDGSAKGHIIKMTGGEIMNLYALTQNDDAYNKLIANGFNITERRGISPMVNFGSEQNETAIAKIVDTLTPQQKKIVDQMVDYISTLGEEGNKTSLKIFGRETFLEPRHWKIEVQRAAKAETQYTEEGLPQGMSWREVLLTQMGMLKEKVQHGNPLVIGNVFDLYNTQVSEMARFTYMAIPSIDVLQLLADMDIPLNERMGTKFAKRIKETIYRETGMKKYSDQWSLPDRMFAAVQRRIAIEILGFRPTSYFSNRIGGSALIATEIMMKDYGLGMDFLMESAKGPVLLFTERNRAIAKKIMNRGYFAERWHEGITSTFLNLPIDEDVQKTEKFIRKRKLEMESLRMMANAEMRNTITLFKVLKQNGYSDEKALDYCEILTRRTQNPSTAFEETGAFSEIKRHPAYGLVFPFFGQPSVQKNIFTRAIMSGDPKKVGIAFTGLLVNAAYVAAMRSAVAVLMKGTPYKDREERDKDIIRTIFNAISTLISEFTDSTTVPGAGRILSPMAGAGRKAMNKEYSGPTAPAEVLIDLLRPTAGSVKENMVGAAIDKAIAGATDFFAGIKKKDWPRTASGILDIIETTGKISGKPVGGPVQVIKITSGAAGYPLEKTKK